MPSLNERPALSLCPRWPLLSLALAALVLGCSDSSAPTPDAEGSQPEDAGVPDTAPDTAVDAALDAAIDAAQDAGAGETRMFAAGGAVAPLDVKPFTLVVTPPVAEAAGSFGPEGGSLTLGHVEFVVPAGAVDDFAPLVILQYDVELPAGIGARGTLYGCESRGTTFDPPMQVVFTFDDALTSDTVIAWTNDAGELEILDTTVEGATATVYSSHCSRMVDGLLAGVQAAIAANDLRETVENSECPDGQTEVVSGRCCPDGYTALHDACYLCPEGRVPGPVPTEQVAGGIGCYPSPIDGTEACPEFCRWETSAFRGAACCPQGNVCPAPGEYMCQQVVLSCEDPADVVQRGCDGYFCCPRNSYVAGCPSDSCRWDDPCNPHEGDAPCDPLVSCSLARRDLDGDGRDDVWCGACPAGYNGLGWVACEDINECDDEAICYEGATCVNSPGSYGCECDAAACECRRVPRNQQPPGCFPFEICSVDEGGASRCTDRDECVDGVLSADGNIFPACATDEVCIDEERVPGTQGRGYRCECPEGYDRVNDEGTCQDINECARFTCGGNRLCTNSDGGYTCGECREGFEDVDGEPGGDCADIDECAPGGVGCDPLTRCTNTAGGYTCTACPRGYSGDGVAGCEDINECLTDNGFCGLAPCINTAGGHSCGDCPEGTTEDTSGRCVDIDDCLADNGGCDPRVTCNDNGTSITCGDCPSPYLGDGYTGCRLCQATDGVGPVGWGTAEQVTSGGATLRDLAILGNGQAVVAGLGSLRVPFFLQRQAPGAWSAVWEARYDGVDGQSAAVDARGDVAAGVWGDGRFEATPNAARLSCDGWAVDGDVSNAARPTERVQSTDVALLADGTTIAGWYYLNGDPRVAQRTGDGSWGSATTLSAPGSADSFALHTDLQGTVHATWEAYDEGTDRYHVAWAVRDRDTGTWSTPALINTGEISPYAVASAFHVSPSGSAILAWCDDTGSGLVNPNVGPSVRLWDPTTGWGPTANLARGTECEIPEGSEPPAGDADTDFAAHITGDGDAFFAWEADDGELYVSYRTPEDTEWGSPDPLGGGGVADLAFFSTCRRPSCGSGFGDDAFLIWSNTSGIYAIQWNHVRKTWSSPVQLREMTATTTLMTASTSNGAYLAWREAGDIWLLRWGMDSGP